MRYWLKFCILVLLLSVGVTNASAITLTESQQMTLNHISQTLFAKPLDAMEVQPLQGGNDASSPGFVLNDSGQLYVVKFLHSAKEVKMVQQADQLGITPPLIWSQISGMPIVVQPFVQDSHNFRWDSDRQVFDTVLRQIKTMHQLPVTAGVGNDLMSRSYADLSALQDQAAVQPIYHMLEKIQQALYQYPIQLSMTHNDLHAGNILQTPDNQIYLIDWVDSGLGDPLGDFANFLLEAELNGLSESQIDQLIDLYFAPKIATKSNRIHIKLMRYVSSVRRSAWLLKVFEASKGALPEFKAQSQEGFAKISKQKSEIESLIEQFHVEKQAKQ